MDKPTPGAPVAKRHHGEPQVTNTAVTMSSPRPALRHLLVPLDGTSRGEHAIPFAEALAAVSGAQVLLMRVSTAEERHVATIYLATVAPLESGPYTR